MRFTRIALPSLIVIGVLSVASGAGGGDEAPPGSPSNPLVALPNPTAARVPPSEQPPNEGPRQTDGAAAEAPKPTSNKTQQGSTALHRSKPMVAQPETARQQLEQPPSASRPCSLVTRAQARDITGAPIVEPLEAPQGPTCIYQTGRGEQYITLAAQDAHIDQLRDQMRGRTAVSVAGRAGYCGSVGGQPLLYVRLPDGRTLVVTAPCEIAKRFAALALERA